MTDWISINDSLPEAKPDFKTVAEDQRTSDPVWIKLKPGIFRQDEIDGYFVILNGKKLWSVDPSASSQYWKLEIATHWRYK